MPYEHVAVTDVCMYYVVQKNTLHRMVVISHFTHSNCAEIAGEVLLLILRFYGVGQKSRPFLVNRFFK